VSDHDPAPVIAPLDLDAVERDLADVEVALARLDAGTYWTDEVTGEPLPVELLEQHPTARRV
jgi:RNA polymerase-binding transcription factor DksA